MTVHLPVCVSTFPHGFCLLCQLCRLEDILHILTAACLVCTVTCRQFLNLTFAPRKTCYIYLNSNLALLRYQCHNICIIQESFWECKGFFVFFQIHFGRKESGTGGVCVRRAAANDVETLNVPKPRRTGTGAIRSESFMLSQLSAPQAQCVWHFACPVLRGFGTLRVSHIFADARRTHTPAVPDSFLVVGCGR